MPELKNQPLLTVSAPSFWHCGHTIKKNNYIVLLALIPSIIMATITWGIPAARVIALAGVTGVMTEVLCQKLMHQRLSINDLSTLITSILFAFLLPAESSWWIVGFGTFIAITLGKIAFGGLGANPLNASLVGWAILYVAWPTQMDPNAMQLSTYDIDPLFQVKFFGADTLTDLSYQDLLLGKQIGGLGTSQAGGILIGGLLLLLTRTIRWQIPLGFFLGIIGTSFIFMMYNPDLFASPLFHLLTGSTLVGGFFLATETTNSPNRPLPMFLYGLIGGTLVIIIRVYGTYTDGVPFAILLINLLTPLLDMIRPKPFGVK